MRVIIIGFVCLCLSCARAEDPGLPPGVRNTQAKGDRPVAPRKALAKMSLPDGFNITLFAGEPDVRQPVAFSFDARGRLWVVECYSYPKWVSYRDRVLIFEDTNEDGEFDKRTVFWDRGHRLFGIELGFGGVWLAAAPNLLFIPDANGDDVPDGKPVIKLDGFSQKAKHNLVNGLVWGPDGWLYGRHGILAESRVGVPGTPDDQRVNLDCSIWRYHPVDQRIEVVIHGTTNPWGMDWDDHGQAFFSNNVIGHLWHLVPGANYKRMYGNGNFPHHFELMPATSDHLHWAGDDWRKTRGGLPLHVGLGGGHSHSGGMVYLGDNWPEHYRGLFFLNNIHGNRMLFDRLQRRDSGYVGKHGDAFLVANDPWFRGVQIGYGPDGGVFVTDWNDLGECHDSDGSYKSSGRIYKITHGKPKPTGPLNLAQLDDAALIGMQLHRNDWFVRQSRRVLQERAAAGRLHANTHMALREMLQDNPDITRQLRALWALNVTGGVDDNLRHSLLSHDSEYMRWWAVQLLVDPRVVPANAITALTQLAANESTPLVQLALASALQKFPLNRRWEMAQTLVNRSNEGDKTLTLMLWNALEACVPDNRNRAVTFLKTCSNPDLRRYLTRRLAGGQGRSKK